VKPKDRVLQAIKHFCTDRVPFDWWATGETMNKICRYFSLSEEDILKKLNIDIRYAGFDINMADFERQSDGSYQKKLDHQHFVDIWGVTRKKIGEYLEVVNNPLASMENEKEIEKFKPPDISNFDIEKAKLAAFCDFAIIFTGDRLSTRTSFFKLAMYLRGFENFLLDLVTNQKIAEALTGKLFEFHYLLNKKIFENYSKNIDIFMMGDDFGTQTGPLIGIETFRQFFKQPLKKMIELCHQYGIKAMLHSCGSIKIFIPDLIEIGLDILNPIQHTATQMDLKELKKEFGKYICFHGAVDVQKVLPFGTKEEIIEEVKRCIDILGENGGYIFAPSHNIQADVPTENIITMYEAALQHSTLRY